MNKLLMIIISVILISCAGTGKNPLLNLENRLDQFPEYSVVLEDMRQDGNFLKSYYHQYKIVLMQDSIPSEMKTDWIRVPEKFYLENEPYLGMVVLSKTKEKGSTREVAPPGYQYVGNENYGRWRTRSDGSSFWEWYGKYALFRSIFGWGNFRLNRGEYDHWRRNSKRPFFGSKREWGTSGTLTKSSQKSFFDRKKAKMSRSRSGFLKKFNSRIGRTRSSYRSRSFGFGK